jgi:diguanylate cyclase (GGDEF)-like protein
LSCLVGPEGQLTSILAICKDITRQKQLEHELKELSSRDSLTGLYNQRCFYDRLAEEINRHTRQNRPLSLLLFDIDRFKSYNDSRGHLAGDRALQAAARAIHDSTRQYVDIGFRYGGDEFTVILPETAGPQAVHIAERILHNFEKQELDRLTLSIGLCTFQPEFDLKSFIHVTDAMMYEAKRAGGNRVCTYRPGMKIQLMTQESCGT